MLKNSEPLGSRLLSIQSITYRHMDASEYRNIYWVEQRVLCVTPIEKRRSYRLSLADKR
jgi:hypothetical protein